MTITPGVWDSTPIPPDPAFVAQACLWMKAPASWLLGFVWDAYDAFCAHPPVVDEGDLERSITQLLEPRIRDAMSGYEPFYIQHSPFERETKAPAPAQPPAYDLAFVLRADERIMWPLEAKVLETPRRTTDYEREIRDQFLTCRYAPFSGSGAMLGYLLSGSATDTFRRLGMKLGCALDCVPHFAARPLRVSKHRRLVPRGKSYPSEFECYHLILEYHGLRRPRRSANSKPTL
jgi:hypothetical protein